MSRSIACIVSAPLLRRDTLPSMISAVGLRRRWQIRRVLRSCRESGLAKHVGGGPGRSVWTMGAIELPYGGGSV